MVDLERIKNTLTSTYWHWVFMDPTDCPATVLDALLAGIPAIDPGSWESRSAFGGIYVDGRSAPLNWKLRAPCRLEYYQPKYPIEQSDDYFPSLDDCAVVHEDEDLIALFKPSGLPTLPPKEQKHYHLKGYYQKHFGQDLHFPSRLDTSTAGIIAVSRSSRMNKYLQQAFEKRQIKKCYLLEVEGPVRWSEMEVTAPIGRDPAHSVLRRIDHENGRSAQTRFEKVAEKDGKVLLRAHPLTGRTHQIRVHALSLELPIIGDNFYGGLQSHTLHLLSEQFTLYHPFLDEELEIRLPDRLKPAWATP